MVSKQEKFTVLQQGGKEMRLLGQRVLENLGLEVLEHTSPDVPCIRIPVFPNQGPEFGDKWLGKTLHLAVSAVLPRSE